MMDLKTLYNTNAPILTKVAYQLLGSISDAEDIVQDVFLNLDKIDLKEINSVKSYLTKMVTNR